MDVQIPVQIEEKSEGIIQENLESTSVKDADAVDFKVPSLLSNAGTDKPKPILYEAVDTLKPKLVDQPPAKKSKLSPAERLKDALPLPYKEPSWSGFCEHQYNLDIIKGGITLGGVKLDKPFITFGRLPQCDVVMEHPSISRYHAILQYCIKPSEKRQVGWYLYDLGSSHGTTLNKRPIKPEVYNRVRVGFCVKFGGSTRLFILQGPDEDQEVEITPEELRKLKEKKKENMKKCAEKLAGENDEEGDGEGCGWGMDATELTEDNPNSINPFSHDELHLDDPKKTLRGWFEREGLDQPEYIIEETSTSGKFTCFVELPLDEGPERVEVTVQGKKKEAVVQCAMEACRVLDKEGVLRQAKHESRRRKAKDWVKDDFYDSDDDEYLDRTGDIARKRDARMRRLRAKEGEASKPLTYDELMEQLETIDKELEEINDKLNRSKQREVEANQEIDDLDAYMMSIKSGALNATQKTQLKRRIIDLKKDRHGVARLIKIARPSASLPLRKSVSSTTNSASENLSASLTFHETLPSNNPPTSQSEPNSEPSPSKDANITVNYTHNLEEARLPVGSLTDTNINTAESERENSRQEDQAKSSEVPASEEGESSQTANTSLVGVEKLEKEFLKLAKSTEEPAEVSKPKATDGKKLKKNKAPESSLASTLTDLKSKHEEEKLLNDPNYAAWLPPKGQSGDGKTSLNDKYGY